jgi:hypothetical protein
LARNVATVHVAKAKKLNKEHLDLVREVARNKDKHWASRLAAIFVLGKSDASLSLPDQPPPLNVYTEPQQGPR